MKPLSKLLLQALCLVLLLSTSCYFPGSEKDLIRMLTMTYARNHKADDQQVKFGGVDRKTSRTFEGKEYLYAETHYFLLSPSGHQERKNFYLLLSEDCDSVIDFSPVKGLKFWCSPEYDMLEEMGSVGSFIRDAHRELGIPDEAPFP